MSQANVLEEYEKEKRTERVRSIVDSKDLPASTKVENDVRTPTIEKQKQHTPIQSTLTKPKQQQQQASEPCATEGWGALFNCDSDG
jgi:hypothetical protein